MRTKMRHPKTNLGNCSILLFVLEKAELIIVGTRGDGGARQGTKNWLCAISNNWKTAALAGVSIRGSSQTRPLARSQSCHTSHTSGGPIYCFRDPMKSENESEGGVF